MVPSSHPTEALPVIARITRIAPAWIPASAFEITLKVNPRQSPTLMNKKLTFGPVQPEPFTPGLNKRMVYDHAHKIYQARTADNWPLSREDWILAEKDLLETIRNRNFMSRGGASNPETENTRNKRSQSSRL
jgi:hypothetical protein